MIKFNRMNIIAAAMSFISQKIFKKHDLKIEETITLAFSEFSAQHQKTVHCAKT